MSVSPVKLPSLLLIRGINRVFLNFTDIWRITVLVVQTRTCFTLGLSTNIFRELYKYIWICILKGKIQCIARVVIAAVAGAGAGLFG